jgi:enoyl-CoA hydratase
MSRGHGGKVDGPEVLIRQEGVVGIIELARPQKFNSLTVSLAEQVEQAVDRFAQPASGVKAILLCSQGKVFSTGADLEEIKISRRDPKELKHFLARGHRMLAKLEDCPLPVVAAVQGMALAGGIETMLACDIVFCASDARIGDQHAKYGFIPGWGGTQRLARVIGLRRALDLMLTGRWIDARIALEWGLVNYVVEPEKLRAAALAYCQDFAKRSRTGIATMKTALRKGLEGSQEKGLLMELDVVGAALMNPDVGEGLAAFEGRRDPVFE